MEYLQRSIILCGDLRNKQLDACENFLAAFDNVGPTDSGIGIHKNNVISSSGRRGMWRKPQTSQCTRSNGHLDGMPVRAGYVER